MALINDFMARIDLSVLNDYVAVNGARALSEYACKDTRRTVP